jgi:hypothetical protein
VTPNLHLAIHPAKEYELAIFLRPDEVTGPIGAHHCAVLISMRDEALPCLLLSIDVTDGKGLPAEPQFSSFTDRDLRPLANHPGAYVSQWAADRVSTTT